MESVVSHLLKQTGFSNLKSFQKKAFEKKGNLVISAPTASGKTLIAEGFSLFSILKKHKKVVFTCPLRALSFEHWREFKSKYSSLGIRIALSTGDFDSSSEYLSRYDWIITTNEKLDSLLRHNASWLSSIGLLVIDEIHELDSDRGPVIEMIVAKLKHLNPDLKIIALSATIPNSREIAEWLNADLIESKERPVPLKEGIYFDDSIEFENDSFSGSLESFLKKKIEEGKQILFFANTRKNAENYASQFSHLLDLENSDLKSKILDVLESPTEQCKKLACLAEKGTAFHHAGLVQKQRNLIEEAFIKGKIKIISATPTLAAGVNLPANTVVISSFYRFSQRGMVPIKVREYRQMAGRAGRPKYDKEGFVINIARSDVQKDFIKENYIYGNDEEIISRLSNTAVLRTHLLALIASNYVFDLDSMNSFFKKTFFAYQYGDISSLLIKLEDIRRDLEEMGFVKGFKATDFGIRTSNLYLDPLSAYNLVKNLSVKSDIFNQLFAFADTTELGFGIPVRKDVVSLIEENKEKIALAEEKEFSDFHFDEKVALASVLYDWINEARDDEIMKTYGVLPGQLRSILETVDWISYSAKELTQKKEIEKTRVRLKYGIKEELLPLVKIKGIGRVRARLLYNNGIKKIIQLRKTDILDLQRILGKKTAVQIKKFLH